MQPLSLLAVFGLGFLEMVVLVVVVSTSLIYFLQPSPARLGRIVGRIMGVQPRPSGDPAGVQQKSRSAFSDRPTEHGNPVPASSPRQASDCPAGTYLQWPAPVMCLLLLLGIVGAAAGSGGSGEGFAVALLLNPIIWGAVYSFRKIGAIRCPHCRRSLAMGAAVSLPVGSVVTCSHCANNFVKPTG